MIRLRRVYDEPSPDDGVRVLVERFWPRGISKADAKIDLWMREVAPSDALRKWYAHQPVRWPMFRDLYLEELNGKRDKVEKLQNGIRGRRSTLVFATRDPGLSSAAVLKRYLELPGGPRKAGTRDGGEFERGIWK